MTTSEAAAATGTNAALDALLTRITGHEEFPTLGLGLGRLIAGLDDEATHGVADLARMILSDANLTQRVLRMANSVAANLSRTPVTTVSRALMLLGVETVRIAALSSLLLERIRNKRQAAQLRAEFAQVFYASALARQLAERERLRDPEEAAVATMLRNVGRLVLAVYAFDAFEQVRREAARLSQSEDAALEGLYGVSFDELSRKVLEAWALPPGLFTSVTPIGGCPEPTWEHARHLQHLAEFSTEVAWACRHRPQMGREGLMERALARFGKALSLDARVLGVVMEATDAKVADFGRAFDGQELLELSEPRLDPAGEAPTQSTGSSIARARQGAVANPADRRQALHEGIEELSRAVTLRWPADRVIGIALEIVHRSFDLQRVLFAAPQAHVQGSLRFAARHAFGHAPGELLERFSFATGSAPCLFGAVMTRNVDLHIRDMGDMHVRGKVPSWYVSAFGDAKGLLLLPVAVDERPAGLLYGDCARADQFVIEPDEMQLLRRLKQQLALALRAAMDSSRPGRS